MSHHDFSLSGIPTTAYLGSTIPDGSVGVSAAYARDITLYFNQPTVALPIATACMLGIAIPTLTLMITATPKGGSTQTLVGGTDFISHNNELSLYTQSCLLHLIKRKWSIDTFGFDGITKDNVSDHFINGTYFVNVARPDTTYTITYSPNYFWNPLTKMPYDQEISITFTTRPVQAAFTLEVKRDMVQELANTGGNGIVSLVEDDTGCEIRYPRGRSVLTQGRTDTTSGLYDYAVDRFSKYTVIDLSKWDSLGYADWYTGMTEKMKSDTAVITGTTYATKYTTYSGKTYHYYDIHMEVW